jgi:hypothetical protein
MDLNVYDLNGVIVIEMSIFSPELQFQQLTTIVLTLTVFKKKYLIVNFDHNTKYHDAILM